jgi:HlyD family secretion protein
MNFQRSKVSIMYGTISILLLISFLILQLGCESDSGTPENNSEKLIPSVEAIQARYGALPLTERLTGIVKAKNQIEIYPQISAVIISVNVMNGDIVKKGQPLIRLRDREFQERLKQARANLQITVAQAKQAEARFNEIQSELKRTESLAEKGFTSTAELESSQTQAISAEANFELAKAQVKQAQATVDEREETLSETIIRAPVSGTIGNRNAEVGMLVNPNMRLFTLGQLDNIKIDVVLTDKMLNYIKIGQRTDISAENLASASVEAALSRISPFLHPVTHSTDAEIDLANVDGRFNPGMFVTVDVRYGESEKATLIPLSALYDNPVTGVTGVYVCRDSLKNELISGWASDKTIKLSNPVSFEFVPIEVIAKGRMQAGIRGVEPGQWVVTLGQNLLGGESGNARVRPVNWDWVEQLQSLQRQDLLKEVMKQQQEAARDTSSVSN